MSTLYNQVLLEYLDANNQPAVTFWGTQDQTPGGASAYTALATATQALCDARITHITYQQVLALGGSPAQGDYQSVFDRAQFLGHFQGSRSAVQFGLPGPKASIFQAGHELVDMSNPLVQAWVAQMLIFVGDGSGAPLNDIVRGIRTRARGN